MKQLKTLSLFVTVLILIVTVSCKGQEEKTRKTNENKILYPENEIPVNTANQEALVSFMDGMKLYEMGNRRKARGHFDEALMLDPNFVSAQIYRAFTNSSAKDWSLQRDKALAMRDKANEGEKLLIRSLEAGVDGDLEKELKNYKELASKYPKSAQAQDFLATYYFGENEIEMARDYWKKALELSPDYIPATQMLGRSFAMFEPTNYKEAEKYLKQALELTPNNSKAHINLGDGYRAQNKLQKALESYHKAIQLDSSDDVAHMKAGHANTMLGNYEAARKNYVEGRKVSEFGMNGMAFIAYSYLYEGNHKKAVEVLMENITSVDAMDIPASNKNMANYNFTSDAAQIAMHYGDHDTVELLVAAMKPYSEQFKKEVASSVYVNYQNAYVLYWEGMAALAANDFQGAQAKAEESKAALASVKDTNKLRQYHFLHGMINYKKGNYEKAMEHFLQTNQDVVYNKYWLAKTYEKLGDKDQASKLFMDVKSENFNNVANALVKNEVMNME